MIIPTADRTSPAFRPGAHRRLVPGSRHRYARSANRPKWLSWMVIAALIAVFVIVFLVAGVT